MLAGLTDAEAGRRLARVGPNTVATEERTGALTLLLHQLASPVVCFLGPAGALSLDFGNSPETERRCLAHRALARRAHRVTPRTDHAREPSAARRRDVLRRGGQGERQQRYGSTEEGVSSEHQWHIRQQRGERSRTSRVTPPNIHSRNREWP
ncbi:cation-transporting P-type ATPase [Methylobacterium sp. DCY52]|uniref:cation-transporting P-type ATPase n=1 Tax=Methylobacterium sp. DCY52 TaxID=739139 RepID=UPI001FED34FC|nr:cation-transporting P-type ATPase [Methylobacterium sp. 2A]